jgi:curved DNA-binding protein CbpA
MTRKHYDILQVKPDSSVEEIQRAYRRLALRYHPDRNPSPDAAAQMAAINEAYETIKLSERRQPVDSTDSREPQPAPIDDLTFSIISAARLVILRHGWVVSHDDGTRVVFEMGKPSVRILLTDRLSNDGLLRYTRQYRDLAAVLAVRLEGPIPAVSRISVIDLMHAQRYGAAIPEGPCKSLLSGFL